MILQLDNITQQSHLIEVGMGLDERENSKDGHNPTSILIFDNSAK